MTDKKIMIYGAGQAGEMAACWLPGGCTLAAFIDADKNKQGSVLAGVPVISPETAFSDPADHPDAVYLCVMNREAAEEIRAKIAGAGFAGEIIDIPALRAIADIRLSFLRLKAREMKENGTSGDLAELGVYKGGFAREMNLLFPKRDLLLFDTFEGFDGRDLQIEREEAADGRNARAAEGDFGDTSEETVRKVLPYPEKAVFLKGYFPDSLKMYPQHGAADRKYCIVSLDADLYGPTLEGLRFFYPRLAKGGVIIVHDYNSSRYPGVKRAVRKFAEQADINVIPLSDLHGTAVIS